MTDNSQILHRKVLIEKSPFLVKSKDTDATYLVKNCDSVEEFMGGEIVETIIMERYKELFKISQEFYLIIRGKESGMTILKSNFNKTV